MNQDNDLTTGQALKLARKALRKGNKSQVHHWASLAARQSPTMEDPWLLLAAIGEPRASVVYAEKALQLNPVSVQASKALKWALQRQKAICYPNIPLTPSREVTSRLILRRGSHPVHLSAVIPWIFIILILCGALIIAPFLPAGWVLANNITVNKLIIASPFPSSSNTAAPTFTITISPSPTNTITPTTIPTATPLPLTTSTPAPTETMIPSLPPPTEVPIVYELIPETVKSNERWIDVNLSNQVLFAYEGDQIVNTFIISTGTWEHPTVTGQYRIYVKYRFDDMTGPGYYLPDVPYTMYFYKGYSLHGTYWHNNFGTPMSHGCVNLRTEDAAWLFDFASEGTLVNIHY
jgi:lipoprotein-anchoring transpeptidase ErfK/SrfK